MYFDPKSIISVAKQLNEKKVGIFPCDTIWGLIGVCEKDVVDRILDLKKRDAQKPFLVLIPHIRYLDQIAEEVSDQHVELIKKYWPGPLTLLFNKTGSIDDSVTAGFPTVGVRLPEFLPLNYLLLLCNRPLISTSVNISTEPSTGVGSEFPKEITDNVDFVYRDIEPRWGQESDVVDATTVPFKVLRKSLLFNS